MTSLSILRDSIWSTCGEQEGESMKESGGGEGGGEWPGRFLFSHRVGVCWPLETGRDEDG